MDSPRIFHHRLAGATPQGAVGRETSVANNPKRIQAAERSARSEIFVETSRKEFLAPQGRHISKRNYE
jgi:hypothetical protein